MSKRFSQLNMDRLNAEQHPLAEQILKVSRVGLAGPYNPLLRSPVLGQKMFDLLYYLRWQTSVPLRLNEFAILIIGRQWRSQVEWFAHAPLAIKAGLSPASSPTQNEQTAFEHAAGRVGGVRLDHRTDDLGRGPGSDVRAARDFSGSSRSSTSRQWPAPTSPLP